MDKTYIINGYTVSTWYAGIDCYSVNGKVCYNLATLAKLCCVDVETLKDEMWNQR